MLEALKKNESFTVRLIFIKWANYRVSSKKSKTKWYFARNMVYFSIIPYSKGHQKRVFLISVCTITQEKEKQPLPAISILVAF